MRYTYKRVKRIVPACPVCEEELEGNGSGLTPYECKCGVWEHDWMTGEYEIIPINKDHETS